MRKTSRAAESLKPWIKCPPESGYFLLASAWFVGRALCRWTNLLLPPLCPPQKFQLDRVHLQEVKRSSYEHTKKCADQLLLLGQVGTAPLQQTPCYDYRLLFRLNVFKLFSHCLGFMILLSLYSGKKGLFKASYKYSLPKGFALLWMKKSRFCLGDIFFSTNCRVQNKILKWAKITFI